MLLAESCRKGKLGSHPTHLRWQQLPQVPLLLGDCGLYPAAWGAGKTG